LFASELRCAQHLRTFLLIADGHPVHRCQTIRQLAAESNGRLCLLFLPAYSPDLSPDELEWGYLKHHKFGKLAIKGPAHLKQRIRKVMRSLQKIPALVRSMFQHPSVRYAA
jgi:transposase